MDQTPSGETVRHVRRSLRQHLESWPLWGVTQLPAHAMTRRRATRRSPAPAAAPAAVKAPDVKPLPVLRSREAKAGALRELAAEVAGCTRCRLHETRTKPVFGEGNPAAPLVFVGEAPGRDEDLQGRPFVGAAGQLLTKMIEAMGLKREDVYICNVVKNRPPENRQPLPDEIEACRPFLVQQLAIIRPAVICALGSVAAKTLLGPQTAITAVRGRVQWYGDTPVVPTFHPAYLLRNPDAKKLVWQDLKQVMKVLEDPQAVRSRRPAASRQE